MIIFLPFLKDDSRIPSISLDNTSIQKMPPLCFQSLDIQKAINSLKNKVSQTPDNVPAFFLKRTSHTIWKPLNLLYKISLTQMKIPKIWKSAIVVPIHKKGLKNNPKNFRPISLTSTICRVLEHLIRTHTVQHLTRNSILSSYQHGFLSRRSTLTQHLCMLDQLTKNFENKISTSAIYLDFAKAFDSVPHQKLIYILKQLKFDNSIIGWMTDFLSGRNQRTVVDGVLSDVCDVTSGVPQGSVLGPTLFTIMLNDLLVKLESCTHISCFAFADDLKILGSDHTYIQDALNVIDLWSQQWQLRIQPDKSEFILFKSSKHNQISHSYSIGGKLIKEVTTVKDLGVHLSDNFRWNNQITRIVSKSIRLVYIIVRTFKSNDQEIYVRVYKSHIRPILEYNSSIWNPCLKSEIIKIESVQRTFTRILCKKLNISYTSYLNRLDILGLQSLEHRRIKTDLILAFKIRHNLIDTDANNFFIPSNVLKIYNLRRHNDNLTLPRSKSSVRSQFFTNRIAGIWNELPERLVMSDSLAIFKNNLNSADLSKFFNSHFS